MPTSAQVLTPEAEDQHKGISGFFGISAAIDGTTASTLDITVAANAFAELLDGTLLDTSSTLNVNPLANATITGLTTTGSYTLYLGYTYLNGALSPLFYAALTSVGPTTVGVDIPIATFAVAANVVTTGSVTAAAVVGSAHNQLKTLAIPFVFGSTTVAGGTLPANSVIVGAVLSVATAFNAATNNQYEVGKTGTLNDLFQSATTTLATATTTFVANIKTGSVGSSAYPVVLTVQLTGGSQSTGAATLTILYTTP